MSAGDIVSIHYDHFNRADYGAWREMLTPDITFHHASAGDIAGRDAYFDTIRAYRSSFPDASVELHRLVEQGDLVAAEFTSSATFSNEFAGIAPSGKKWTLPGMGFYSVEGEKLAEAWFVEDFTAWLQALSS